MAPREGVSERQRKTGGLRNMKAIAQVCWYEGYRNPFWISNKKDSDPHCIVRAEINNESITIKLSGTIRLIKCNHDEIIDVITNHQPCMIKRRAGLYLKTCPNRCRNATKNRELIFEFIFLNG